VSQEFTFHGKSPVGSVRFIPSDSLNELTRLVVWIQISPNQWSNGYTHHSGFRAEWTAAFHFSHVYVYFPRSLLFFFFSTHTRVCVSLLRLLERLYWRKPISIKLLHRWRSNLISCLRLYKHSNNMFDLGQRLELQISYYLLDSFCWVLLMMLLVFI